MDVPGTLLGGSSIVGIIVRYVCVDIVHGNRCYLVLCHVHRHVIRIT